MKNVENYKTSSLKETPELIDILNGTTYDETGLTLEEIKEYFVNNSRLTESQIEVLFSNNKFNSDPTMRYKFAEQAEGTADFGEYVTEVGDPVGDIFAWNPDTDSEDDYDYCASSFTTDNLFIIWGGSCMGDDDSILIVSESF